MSSLKERVVGFMRQLSISNLTTVVESIGTGDGPHLHSSRTVPREVTDGCFIMRYLNGVEEKQKGPAVVCGRKPDQLPSISLDPFQNVDAIIAAFTGPEHGLTSVNVKQKHLSISDPDVDYIDIIDQQSDQQDAAHDTEIAGVTNWFCADEKAYGIATTLYEKNPTTNSNIGDPIADCFGLVVRPNAAILAIADGVNWGPKASIAARSAVHGSIEYLNKALFSSLNPNESLSTHDVFVSLLRSFHAAHSLILQEQGMLTTLTVCVVLPLPKTEQTPSKFVACTCNVGDSLAYVYSRTTGVREITRGSHDVHRMRDMRDALGALGPVNGSNPELNNLTLAMTEIEEGDIVFLTSDGISDNFDPVVGKFAILPNNDAGNSESSGSCKNTLSGKHKSRKSTNPRSHVANNLPVVDAYQRHELTLLRMEDLLRKGVSGDCPPCDSAKRLCELVIDFAISITAAKRRILEDTDLYYEQKDGRLVPIPKYDQKYRRMKLKDKISMVPGKLDHATVVAYVAGYRDPNNSQ